MARFAAASHETVTLAGMQIRPAINYHSRGNQPRVIVNLDAKFHEREREREREKKEKKSGSRIRWEDRRGGKSDIFFDIFRWKLSMQWCRNEICTKIKHRGINRTFNCEKYIERENI